MPEMSRTVASEGLVFRVDGLDNILEQAKRTEVLVMDQTAPMRNVTEGLGRLAINMSPSRTEEGESAIGLHGRIEMSTPLSLAQRRSLFTPSDHRSFISSGLHNRSLEISDAGPNQFRIKHVVESILLLSLDEENRVFTLTNDQPESNIWPKLGGDTTAEFSSFMEGYAHVLNYAVGMVQSHNPATYSLKGNMRLNPKINVRHPARRTQIPSQRRPIEAAQNNKGVEVIAPDQHGVQFSDVCGLEKQKHELQIIARSFKHPEIMERWGAARPAGLLLHGPDGTGKTMLIKALANEVGATLWQVSSADIYQAYVGQSEARMQEIFDEAREHTDGPLIVFFDEIDTIIAIANDAGDSNGSLVRNNVAGIFKRETNTLTKENPNVMIAATTNRMDAVHPSIIRSGRFTKLQIPPPTEEGRRQILNNLIFVDEAVRRLNDYQQTGKEDSFRRFEDDIDTAALARIMEDYTGADISEVIRGIKLSKAMQEAAGKAPTPISHKDILDALWSQRRAA